MPKQSKFENVDLFASLNAVMKQNTGFYQSDLEIDKEIIAKAAASPRKEDKTLLWFCRPSGTHCFRERDVFLKDTAPHNTWRFYMEQTSDRVLAYAIELTGTECGKIKGNLYELDYARHYERVKEKELPADTVKLIYEHGERVQEAGRYFDGTPDPQLGKFERFEALPNDPDALQSLLQEERRSREQLSPGDFKAHITALRDGLIEREARRIVREMKRHYEPNSPNKTHFMAELSPAFMRLAATKDTDRLFSMLPYKTLAFSKIEGRHSLLCKWFRAAVLPADRLLYAELYQTGDKKKCTECGAFFASTSNSVKYCPVCRKRITRRQAAERMRKRRAPVTQ